MGKIAVYAGSFDPVTRGHEDMVRRAVRIFDRVVVAIGTNGAKSACFPLEMRLGWLRACFRDLPQVEVASYEGLTVDFCRQCGAGFLLRGLRSAADWEAEQNIAFVNRQLAPEVETVWLPAEDALVHVSSSNVRDIWRNGGDVSAFLPEGVELPPSGSVRG